MGYIEDLKPIAFAAGKAIMRFYGTTNMNIKDDGSPVTVADHAANDIIIAGIQQMYPRHDILSEESRRSQHSAFTWIIDPLDGTKEFLKGNGEFTVNIALVHNQVPIFGLIYAPVQNLLYWAEQGKGAFKDMEKITVSTQSTLSALKLVVSRSHTSEAEQKIQAALETTDVLSRGSSLKGCMVAEGSADLYYRAGNVHEWDICAMDIIIREAGGMITGITGEPLKYCQEAPIQGFLASNGVKHQDILTLL